MRKPFLLVFALITLASVASAQNTPAPCSPANLVPTDVKQGCYNTPDCDTGFMCAFVRVMTDVVYGTTCSAELMYFCSYPNVAQQERNHVQTLLARVRARRLNDRS